MYVSCSPLNVTNKAQMATFYIKLTSLNDFHLEEVFKLTSVNDFPLEEVPVSPTGQFKQSLDSFYVTDSHLSVTNIAQMAILYLN